MCTAMLCTLSGIWVISRYHVQLTGGDIAFYGPVCLPAGGEAQFFICITKHDQLGICRRHYQTSVLSQSRAWGSRPPKNHDVQCATNLALLLCDPVVDTQYAISSSFFFLHDVLYKYSLKKNLTSVRQPNLESCLKVCPKSEKFPPPVKVSFGCQIFSVRYILMLLHGYTLYNYLSN